MGEKTGTLTEEGGGGGSSWSPGSEGPAENNGVHSGPRTGQGLNQNRGSRARVEVKKGTWAGSAGKLRLKQGRDEEGFDCQPWGAFKHWSQPLSTQPSTGGFRYHLDMD